MVSIGIRKILIIIQASALILPLKPALFLLFQSFQATLPIETLFRCTTLFPIDSNILLTCLFSLLLWKHKFLFLSQFLFLQALSCTAHLPIQLLFPFQAQLRLSCQYSFKNGKIFFVISCAGCIIVSASFPSFVIINNPSVSLSSLPTANNELTCFSSTFDFKIS